MSCMGKEADKRLRGKKLKLQSFSIGGQTERKVGEVVLSKCFKERPHPNGYICFASICVTKYIIFSFKNGCELLLVSLLPTGHHITNS